jgi:hypothetical protein
MSIQPIARRDFLTLAGAFLLAPGRVLAADPGVRRNPYAVDIGLLYSMFTFHLEGTYEEHIDRATGRYEIRSAGEGERIANRMQSTGMFRDGRWVPVRGESWFQLYGRESRTHIAYDHDRRRVEYHAKGETFLRRRLRVVDDEVSLPDGLQVDDAISAALNYRDGRWRPDAQGRLRTHIVRRRQSDTEGPDEVARAYRAEIVPLELTVKPDPESQKPAALLDLSRFSSWARSNQPARIVFDEERRPLLITGPMILGSTVSIRLG